MLIEAATPFLRDGRLTLDVIGDGPMLSDLTALAKERGVSDAITFHGWVAHEEVQQIASQCQVMTFPSIREFGGGVVLEAMAMGVVPVIVDYAGPGELLVPGTGFKVPLGSRDEIIARMRAQLEEILSAPQDLEEISKRGHAYVKDHFTWSAKARQVRSVYDWVLGDAPAKPTPFPADLPPAQGREL